MFTNFDKYSNDSTGLNPSFNNCVVPENICSLPPPRERVGNSRGWGWWGLQVPKKLKGNFELPKESRGF